MALTAHNLHKLKNHHSRDEVPDPVTAFVIHQQALHQHGNGLCPQISDNRGEVRGLKSAVKSRQSLELHSDRTTPQYPLAAFAGSAGTPSAQEIDTEQANRKHFPAAHRSPLRNTAPNHRKHRRESSLSDSSLIQYAERASATAGLTNARRAAGNTDTGEITGYESGGADDEQRVDCRRTKKFEKRARHKMLDPVKKNQKKPPKKAQPGNNPPKKKKGQAAAQNKTDALVEGFSADNIAKKRITLQPSHKLGIFRNGRASSPVLRKGLPDLTFSEVDFLHKRTHRSLGAREADVDEEHRENSFVPPERAEGAHNSISRPTSRPKSFARTLTFHSRRSTTFNPDEHSQYSLMNHELGGVVSAPHAEAASISAVDPQEGCSKRHNSPELGAQEALQQVFVTLPQEKPSTARRPTPTPLDELLRLCEEIPATEVNTRSTDQHGSGVVYSPVAPRNFGRKEDSLPSEYADFVGNAYAEAYRASPSGHLAYEPTEHPFSRAYRDLDMAPAARCLEDEWSDGLDAYEDQDLYNIPQLEDMNEVLGLKNFWRPQRWS